MTERTHEQALSYIIELEAELSQLRFELEEVTTTCDAKGNLVDEQEEELHNLRYRVVELESVEPRVLPGGIYPGRTGRYPGRAKA